MQTFDGLVAEIGRVNRPEFLDALGQEIWKGLARARFSEDEAGRLSETLEAQRIALKANTAQRASTGLLKAPRLQRSPDKQRSLERRRKVAASGRMPPALACCFTIAEQAVLAIVASEVQRRGSCQMPIDKIAALAGCSRTTVQNALREASRLRLLNVSERRYRGRPSGYNVIRVVDAAWSAWLRLGGQGGGFRKFYSTDTRIQITPKKAHRAGFDQGGNLLNSSVRATQVNPDEQRNPVKAIL